MHPLRYAVVAYIKDEVGEFVRRMRTDLHPQLHHSAAHVSILPPRYVEAGEAAILETFEALCATEIAFPVQLGAVATFAPVTPTIYLPVEGGAERMCQMHRRFGESSMGGQEDWPYVPHMTILKTVSMDLVAAAQANAEAQWSAYSGDRTGWVRELTFVRENAEQVWVDLATFPLGAPLL